MNNTQVGFLLALLIAAIPLVALAKRVNVSYPIVLVLGGLVLGFIPGLPHIQLDPNIVLLVFLPPLLYWEAITAPSDIMLENAGQIGVLAFGLVIVPTIVVAVVGESVASDGTDFTSAAASATYGTYGSTNLPALFSMATGWSLASRT